MRLPANQLGLVYGRSGAGKSTLLYLLAGLLQPTHGAISLTTPGATGSSPGVQLGAHAGLARPGLPPCTASVHACRATVLSVKFSSPSCK